MGGLPWDDYKEQWGTTRSSGGLQGAVGDYREQWSSGRLQGAAVDYKEQWGSGLAEVWTILGYWLHHVATLGDYGLAAGGGYRGYRATSRDEDESGTAGTTH